jgi:cytoskeleton protein RodZ
MAEESEVEPGATPAQEVQPATPGAKLRVAREAQGLSVQDVATRTRIAQRQLEAIERDDYAALPGIPYAVGFARAYARAVDVDEVAIAAEVREAVHGSDLGANRYEAFEPADPARVPSRTLAWTLAAIVLLLVGGYIIWRTQLFTPPSSEEIAAQEPARPAARPAGAAPVAPMPQMVVFTAVDDVWLRIVDEAGERLKDGTMKKGESFTLPTGARNPTILTGRPQALNVTVGGKSVAPLGEADRTIADVPVSAEALLARGAQAPAATARPALRPTAQRLAAPAVGQPAAAPAQSAPSATN